MYLVFRFGGAAVGVGGNERYVEGKSHLSLFFFLLLFKFYYAIMRHGHFKKR